PLPAAPPAPATRQALGSRGIALGLPGGPSRPLSLPALPLRSAVAVLSPPESEQAAPKRAAWQYGSHRRTRKLRCWNKDLCIMVTPSSIPRRLPLPSGQRALPTPSFRLPTFGVSQ